MDNHPVPQNISSYEFRLVGDMTLKQFLQLASGIIAGVLIFRLQLIAIIKYPLSGLCVLVGFLMAFVPINGRPFSSWLTAFIKAIYSPTEYAWVPDELLPPPPAKTPPTEVSSPASPATPTVTPPASPKPNTAPAEVTPIIPSFSAFLASKVSGTKKPPVIKETTMSTVDSIPKVTPSSSPPTPSTPTVSIPTTPPPTNSSPNTSSGTVNLPSIHAASTPQFTNASDLPKTSSITSAPSAATTSLISPPTSPNILSGLILDDKSQPLPQITVEIVDTNTGIPARALRTNKLGQFQIAIPLPAGTYNVIAEKDDLKFEPVSIQIKGGIVPPVIIQGKQK